MSDETREEIKEALPEVEKLRAALMRAKAVLLEQNAMIEQLTSPPYTYATVAAIVHGSDRRAKKLNNLDVSADPSELFKRGTRVRIRRDSKFAGQNDGKATVEGVYSHGWVHVIFDDNYVSAYRIGLPDVEGGACDLEIVPDEAPPAAVIMAKGELLEVFLPKDIEILPGDTVRLAETMQIVDVTQAQLAGGIGYLRGRLDDWFSEVDYESGVRVVFNGKFADSLEKGDRVVLDSAGVVILRNLGKEDERFRFTAETNVTWNEIGGLAEAKMQMIEAVELPHKHPEIFRFYGKRPVKGILLYGPPGCGKTMLGKAAATALAQICNGGTNSTGFMHIKGPEILDRYVGVAEATIRQIFQRARKHKEAHGYPAVVFIDEADAILGKRGSGISSDIERTIVPMFLTEMDGLEDSGALVILATNRPDILDPAVIRDGRIDRKIKIDRPTPESAADIFRLNLAPVPLCNGYSREELAQLGSDEVFAPHRTLYRIITRSNGTLNFTLGNIINGGMVVSIIDQATSIAMHRDLSTKKPEGITKDDLAAAVDAVERQNRDLKHTDELAEFVHDFREDVMEIKRLHQSVS